MFNIRTEFKTILLFAIYFTTAFILNKIDRGGPCAPGLGGLLLIFSIPLSIIYLLILIFKLYKSQEKEYQNSIFILITIWILLFVISKYTNL